MPTLYSYCILEDNGAAPNPFWGLCTLAICKPQIRKTAQVGDWVAGTGSVRYGFQNQLVYAMKVTQKMTFEEYDVYCRNKIPEKIPVLFPRDVRLKVGDCFYHYSNGKIIMNEFGTHRLEDMNKDLSGQYVLLSDCFYYFGSKPVPLPTNLLKIVQQGQGHKSKLNAPHVENFIKWISSFVKYKNKVNSAPYGLRKYEVGDKINNCVKNKC